MWIPLLFLAASVHTDFDGGSLGKVTPVSDTHLRLALNGDKDQDGRNRQANWYYFRVDGGAGKLLTLDLVDLPGEYNYQPNKGAVTKDTPPWWSEDQKTWNPVTDFEYDAQEPRMRLRIKSAKNRFWIAHVPPYTQENLSKLVAETKLKPEVIGKTVGGRDLWLLTVSDWSVPDGRKKLLFWMFRQHAWEAGSSWAAEGMIRFLTSNDPQAVAIRRSAVVKILPMCDPDGVAEGKVRFNRNGFDLNRNWDVDDSAKMPEIAAEKKAILSGRKPDFFLSLHNTETAEYVDGPAGPLLDRFFATLESTTRFKPSRRPQPLTGKADPGRFNVAEYLWSKQGIPAFLMEQRISSMPTPADRQQFGRDLLLASWKSATGAH